MHNNSDEYLLSEAYYNSSKIHALNESGQQIDERVKKAITEFVSMAIDLSELAKTKKLNPDQQEIVNAFKDKSGKQLTAVMAKVLNKNSKGSSTQQNEAFENFRSKIGHKFGFGGKKDLCSRRYDHLLRDVNGHLWEMGEDAKTLSVDKGKSVGEFITKITTIEPKVAESGKLLQKLGYQVGRAVGIMSFALPFAVAASYFAPMAGLGLLGAKVLGAALAGAGKTAVLFSNDQMSKKEKLYDILATVFAGYRETGLADLMMHGAGGATPAGGGGTTPSGPVWQPDENWRDLGTQPDNNTWSWDKQGIAGSNKEFPELHDTSFNPASNLDVAKQNIADYLRQNNIVGSSGGQTGIASPHIMNAMDTAGINTSAEYTKVLSGLKNLSTQQLQNMQKNSNYAVRMIKWVASK